jgi:acetylornithine deacetylase
LPTVVCGPGSIAQAHKADEFVDEAQLAACLAFPEGLANELSRWSQQSASEFYLT